MQFIYPFLSILVGYLALDFFSKPGSRVQRKVPRIKVKNIELLPSLKITIHGRIIHLHHWLFFTLLLCVSVFVSGGILDSWITRGFMVGGAVQGLKFPDRGIFKKIT